MSVSDESEVQIVMDFPALTNNSTRNTQRAQLQLTYPVLQLSNSILQIKHTIVICVEKVIKGTVYFFL